MKKLIYILIILALLLVVIFVKLSRPEPKERIIDTPPASAQIHYYA